MQYAILHSGNSCVCNNDAKMDTLSLSCDIPCTGDVGSTCGGAQASAVFELSLGDQGSLGKVCTQVHLMFTMLIQMFCISAVNFKLDLVFVVDQIGNIVSPQMVLKYIIDFIEIDSKYSRVGILLLSDIADPFVLLNSNKEELLSKIDNIAPRGGKLNFTDALRKLRTVMFTPENGDRFGK